MSTEVLAAILGREAVENMPGDELAALVEALDEEIIRDRTLLTRLRSVVQSAAAKAHGEQPAS